MKTLHTKLNTFFFFKYKGMSLDFVFILVVLGLHCRKSFFLVSGNGTYSPVVHRLLTVVTFVAEHKL